MTAIEKLKEQLISRIDKKDLKEVEKVERYISLVKLNEELDKEIEEVGALVVTENGSQRFTKSNPAIADKIKINSQLLAIEKTFNFVNDKPSSEKEYTKEDLI